MTGEFDIIAKYLAPLAAGAPGALGLTDDAAILAPEPGVELVVTMDTVVEGVHYLAGAPARDAVAKLMGSNLSDLAAMGARPAGFTLACAWTKGTGEAEIGAFAAALGDWISDFDCPLLGGDTVAQPGPAVFTVTAFGRVPAGQALKRSGAKPGDTLYVTGTVGDGALGLAAARGEIDMDAEHIAFLADRYRRPQPRLAAGQALIGRASACIDISDGLVQDAGHIAETSHVDIEIDAATVPLSNAARAALAAAPERLADVLTGGDDYELLFTTPEPVTGLVPAATAIGRVVEGRGQVRVLGPDGESIALARSGFRHF